MVYCGYGMGMNLEQKGNDDDKSASIEDNQETVAGQT